MNTDQVQNSICTLIGQAPFFDEATQWLFYCDVFNGTICKYDTTTKKTVCGRIQGENQVSFIIPVRGQTMQFVCGAGNKILLVTWNCTNQQAKVERVLCQLTNNNVRFNDAVCDQQGRLFVCTMLNEDMCDIYDNTRRVCGIYRFTVKTGLQMMKDQMGNVGGMCIDETMKKLFAVDMNDMKVRQYDWDNTTGNITNEKVMMDLSKQCQPRNCVPMGMTLDQDGNLYICMNGGGKVLRINAKTCVIDQELKFQAMNITNCTFAGRSLNTLICTSAMVDFDGQQKQNQLNQQLMQLNGRLQQCCNMQVQGQRDERCTPILN